MNDVAFLPWVGSHYDSGVDGVKVLILGESHYFPTGCEPHPDFTNEVIKLHAIGPRRQHPFFTKIAKTVLNRMDLPDEVRFDFWQRVAFYNYVQESVGDDARQRPSPEMWGRSEKAFLQVLQNLRPDGVVVLGRQLWSRLPACVDVTTSPAAIRLDTHVGSAIPAINTVHPSGRGFRYDIERPKVGSFLESLRMNIAPQGRDCLQHSQCDSDG